MTAAFLEGAPSAEHERFRKVRERLGLPLNAGKRLIGSYRATLQGGEFDGRRGIYAHARKRGRHLQMLSLG
eukprot:8258743-Pyramimonas_sp.AAC.1